MTASEQIQILIKHLKMNAKSFSDMIGYERPQIIYDIIKGKTKRISEPLAIKIVSVFPEISKLWLLTGEGEMLNSTLKPQQYYGGDTENQKVNEPQMFIVPLMPISAKGGTLDEFSRCVMDNDCEKILSPIKGADFAITVCGDSMSPDYPSGCHILIKKIEERAFIDWGKVFVLDTVNGTIIKKLMPVADDPSKIRCISINPEYPPYEISLEYVRGIYRVLMCMSLK